MGLPMGTAALIRGGPIGGGSSLGIPHRSGVPQGLCAKPGFRLEPMFQRLARRAAAFLVDCVGPGRNLVVVDPGIRRV